MADLKLLDELPKRQKPPAIPGGSKRPSLRASLLSSRRYADGKN